MTNELSTRAILAETGLHIRACEILGIKGVEETTAEKYAAALVEADEEGAGRAYCDKIIARVDRRASDVVDRSEAVHRAAVSHLRATGKQNYSADEYVAACNLVQDVET